MKTIYTLILFLVLTGTVKAASFYANDYERIAPSQTDQTLGPVGGAGDVVEKLIVSVNTAATGTVKLKDGSGIAMDITTANTPIGVYPVVIGARSIDGAWKVSTGAGASVIAVGKFQ